MGWAMSIPLDQLEPHPSRKGARLGDDGKWRDRYDRMLIVPPGARLPEGYTRVTTIANATDHGGGLLPWGQTMGICGALQSRALSAQWEALLAEHRSPWYAGDAVKDQCKRLAKECAKAGGGEERRDLGTALHKIVAQMNAGKTPHYLGDTTLADMEAYCQTLEDNGVEVIPELVETSVVLDRYKVAGTPDMFVRIRGRRMALIADLKTGADVSYSWGSFSAQLAGYARGDNVYRQGATPDDDERAPMPEVDQHQGLVVWLPAGEARCELHLVDLDQGWEGFMLGHAVHEWRYRKGLARPFAQSDDVVMARWEDEHERQADNAYRARRQWLQQRIDVLGLHADTRATLAQRWPATLPTLKSYDRHEPAQLDAIAHLLDEVETLHSVPFTTPDPTTPTPPQRHKFPNQPTNKETTP